MKQAIDYITKFRLKETKHFSHAKFVEDLRADFEGLIQAHDQHGTLDYSNFRGAVNDTREKLDVIIESSQLEPSRWESLWRFFYAMVVCKIRDELFDEDEGELPTL